MTLKLDNVVLNILKLAYVLIMKFAVETFCAQGALGKKSISAVPTAAQVRVVRKASTDHLAINIDSESEQLMNNNEADEDKGQN